MDRWRCAAIDPEDEHALVEWYAVLRASDEELWPDRQGFTLSDIRAFARFRGAARRFELLAAGDRGGPILGAGLMELPQRDNRHGAEITMAVHPAQRRRGVGTAIVERMGELAVADGRRVLNTIVDVPLDRAADHASVHFAPRAGFEATLTGNTPPPRRSRRQGPARQDAARGRRWRSGRRGLPDHHLRRPLAGRGPR